MAKRESDEQVEIRSRRVAGEKKLSAPERALAKASRENPLPGTIGHTLLEHDIDNLTLYSWLLEIHQERPQEGQIKKVINDFNRLGEVARRRPSIWDDLCRANRLQPSVFMALVVEHNFRKRRDRSLLILSNAENDVVAALTRFAQKEENLEDRKTYLQLIGLLKKDQGGINVNVGVGVKVEQTQQKGLPSVEDLTSDATRMVREHRQKMLTEGSTEDYVDAEVVSEVQDAEPISARRD